MSLAMPLSSSPACWPVTGADRRTEGFRAPGPFRQAVLILGWFRDRACVHCLARDTGISQATGYRYLHEGINVLAGQPPNLHDVLDRCRREGMTHVVLDGTLIGLRRRAGLRANYPQGRQADHGRRGRTPGVLRLPRRALDRPADHEPDRSIFATVRLRTKGHWQPRRRPGHGLQADRVRPGPLASRERTPTSSRSSAPSPLRTRPPHRTPRNELNPSTGVDIYSARLSKACISVRRMPR